MPDIAVGPVESNKAGPPESDPLVRGDVVLTAALRQLRVVLKAF
jgi:hypothetical protein